MAKATKRDPRVKPDHPLSYTWQRVLARTDAGDHGCIEWQGGRHPSGHGMIAAKRDGKWVSLYTHRVAWEVANGPIPDGMCVCHRCDNPPCVNPLHLFLGTRSDNIVDMWNKGRSHLQQATVCRNGHDITQPEARSSYYERLTGKTRYRCRACIRSTRDRFYARHRKDAS